MNAVTATPTFSPEVVRFHPATQPHMSAARVVRAYLVEAKLELVRAMRAPIFVVPFLILPVLLYMLFGIAMAGADGGAHPGAANFFFAGFATFAVLGPALFSVGCGIAVERDQGLLSLKRALPAPPGTYLVGKVLMQLAFAALASGLLATTALLGAHLTLAAGQVWTLIGVLVAGTIPFCALGLLVGTHVSGTAAPGITNLLYFPMLYLSGLFFPLPKVLARWAPIWPTFHLNRLALAAAGGVHLTPVQLWTSVTTLIAITVLCGTRALLKLARRG
jgi:ABC-2 type transport system permease protein